MNETCFDEQIPPYEWPQPQIDHINWLIQVGTCPQPGCSVGDCVHWKGCFNVNGYAIIPIGYRRSALVHRITYELHHRQSIQVGQVTRHMCGNRWCVNVLHLRLGTHQQNAIDTVVHATLSDVERSQFAMISDDVAKVIYASRDTGTLLERADRFGITANVLTGVENSIILNERARDKRMLNTENDYDQVASVLRKKIISRGEHALCRFDRVIISFRKVAYRAQTLAWMTRHKKQVPSGLIAFSFCEFENCVEPAHLTVGTKRARAKCRRTKGGRKLKFGSLDESVVEEPIVIEVNE